MESLSFETKGMLSKSLRIIKNEITPQKEAIRFFIAELGKKLGIS